MGKIDAMQEMYLIYRLMSEIIVEGKWDLCGKNELVAAYRSFCQREPIGGMFLELVLEEMMKNAQESKQC
jgi:hypothetical protein